MLVAKIKKIFATLTGRKQPAKGKGYLHSDIELQPLPGQSSRQAGQYNTQKKRLDRFRQVLTARKRTQPNHQAYNTGTAAKRKIIFKMTGLAAVSFFLLFFIFLGGWQLVLKNIEGVSFFQVSEVVYSGMESIAEEKLREASGIIVHQTSLIGLDCHRVEASLLGVPWVARAVVKRNWPSTVEISIVENVPVALLHSKSLHGAQLQYIDKKGVPFLQVKPGADIDFPVITGLTEIADPQTREKALAEVLVFLKNINGSNPYLPAQSVSEVHLNRDGEMVVYLVENPFPIFFGRSDTNRKYSRLVQVLKVLYKKQNGKGSISQIKYIQMDYLQDKVLVAQSESS
jgi:cell division protein FtsQ